MSESVETALEAAAEQRIINVTPTGATVVIALATYGALQVTKDAVSLTKKVRRNWQARKALKEQETAQQ